MTAFVCVWGGEWVQFTIVKMGVSKALHINLWPTRSSNSTRAHVLTILSHFLLILHTACSHCSAKRPKENNVWPKVNTQLSSLVLSSLLSSMTKGSSRQTENQWWGTQRCSETSLSSVSHILGLSVIIILSTVGQWLKRMKWAQSYSPDILNPEIHIYTLLRNRSAGGIMWAMLTY